MNTAVARAPFWTRPTGLTLFVLGLTAVKLAVAASTGLVRDEAYYWLWSQHLSWGYFDHPPVVAAWIRAGIAIAGGGEIGVRLWSVLATLVLSAALYRTGIVLFEDRRVAAAGVVWGNLAPVVTGSLFITTPDAPSVLLWTLAIWSAAELLKSGRGAWWLAFGLFAGLGLLSKYTQLFLGAGIVIWVLMHRELRPWLRSWQLWAGGALALAIFAPNVVWNYRHEWLTFGKQFGRVVTSEQGPLAVFSNLPEFLADQVGLLSPGLFVMGVIALWAVLRRRHEWARRPEFTLLTVTALPMIAYFIVHTFHARVWGNWTVPAVPPLMLASAWAMHQVRPAGSKARSVVRLLKRWSAPFAGALMALVFIHAAIFAIRVPGDPVEQMHGWPDLRAGIERVARQNGAHFLATLDDYGLTGYLDYYGNRRFGADRLPAVQIDQRRRYGFLPPVSASDLKWPALLVIRADRFWQPRLDEHFPDALELKPIDRTVGGDTLATYRLFLVQKPAGPALTD